MRGRGATGVTTAAAAVRSAARMDATFARAGCSRDLSPHVGARVWPSARACSASTAARAFASGASPRCSWSSTASARRRSPSSSARMPSCPPDCRDQQHRPDAPGPRRGAWSRSCRVPRGGHPGPLVVRGELRPRVDLGDARARARPVPRSARDATRAPTGWEACLHRARRRLAGGDALPDGSSARAPRSWRWAVRARDPQGRPARPHRLRWRSRRRRQSSGVHVRRARSGLDLVVVATRPVDA